MFQNIYSLRKEIVETGRRMYARGYVASNDGNISARVSEDRILITPTGVSKGFFCAEEICLLDMDANVVAGKTKPSSEVYMHLEIYKVRDDVKSISHAHPPYATGFAVAGIPLDNCILPEVVVALGNIPLVEYGTPGTDEFYKSMHSYLPEHDAFLLANHGVVTVGKNILSAYHRMETVEHSAKILFIANQLGGSKVLSKDQVSKLKDLRSKFGITTGATCISCEEDTDSCDVKLGIQKNEELDLLIKKVTEEVINKLKL